MNARSSGKIQVGIVGVGNWGRYGHIPVLRLLPNYEIVAVASRRKEYGKQLAKEFGIPHVFTEPTDLIGYPKVDLVVILPPAPQHAALVRGAIAAGKDVYCEWPLTTTVADTEDLLDRAENFSHILSIYGGHFMDMLFHVVGAPQTVSAVVVNQFPTITITDNGETLPTQTKLDTLRCHCMRLSSFG